MSKKPTGIAHGLTNYGDRDFSLYLRRSFAQSMGYSRGMLEKPVVGIAYTPSGFNNCHRHFPELLSAVKRGVLAAGALPIEFPTISLGEVFLNPTSLKFRNLMSMDTEEMVRAQPMDAVVLMGGCDKTVPAQLMGAVSAGRPAVMLVGGPMMTGRHQGERLGACTDCRRFWAQYRAGKVDDEEISEVEAKLATTAGTCGVMGTASTMACLAGIDTAHAEDGSCTYSTQLALPEQRGVYTAQIKRIKDSAVSPYGEFTSESVPFMYQGERIDLDTVSFDCITCHDGISAPLHDIRFKNDTVRTDGMKMVIGPHPIGMHYGSAAYAKPGTLRDQSSLNEDMVLVDGRVGCLSCHNPLNPEKKHLIVGLDQSKLCLTCHVK